MKSLQGISVLYVAEAVEGEQALGVWIASEGAALHRSTWDALASATQRFLPAVIVADLRQMSGLSTANLEALLADKTHPPIVALVERGASGTALANEGKVHKYITTPVHPGDVIHAIASLAADMPSRTPPSTLETSMSQLLEDCAARNDLRGFLSLVNATGPFRFTSILRFDEHEQLTSLWTFDRENKTADSFPLDATTPSSYCVLVRDKNGPFAMPDAAQEPEVANHPKRYSVLSYCGVPLYDDAASMYGTLCSYDVAPRFFADSTVGRLEETALILRRHAHALKREPGESSADDR